MNVAASLFSGAAFVISVWQNGTSANREVQYNCTMYSEKHSETEKFWLWKDRWSPQLDDKEK